MNEIYSGELLPTPFGCARYTHWTTAVNLLRFRHAIFTEWAPRMYQVGESITYQDIAVHSSRLSNLLDAQRECSTASIIDRLKTDWEGEVASEPSEFGGCGAGISSGASMFYTRPSATT